MNVWIVAYVGCVYRVNGLFFWDWVWNWWKLSGIWGEFIENGYEFYGIEKYGVCWEIMWEWIGRLLGYGGVFRWISGCIGSVIGLSWV